MRFGVPDAKLEKSIIDRRVAILEQEGIKFVYDRRSAATSASPSSRNATMRS